MKKVILIILTISVLSSCKQKVNSKKNSDEIENAPTEKTAIEEKHQNEKLYKGMFSFVAKTDEVAFSECNQEFTVSVIPLKEGEFNSLFNAYKKVQADNVLDFAYVEFKGYITDQKVASEMDDFRTIRITEFLKIDKNKTCD